MKRVARNIAWGVVVESCAAPEANKWPSAPAPLECDP
jgi:hypothetical protein